MSYTIYLSGEIHSDWREQIQQGITLLNLDIEVLGPITDHDSSDHVGVEILGAEEHSFWKDHKAAKINALRTQSYISRSDIVVIRFGDKYRQWNAAFDAGTANGLGIPVIVMHAPELTHALKEVDATALAVTETPQQVIEILAYISQK
ncbi:MAG: YtoQ family protein [Gammaproteobacteria bacterium]|jgi:YtoQ family protein|nr:YtoQ family protein [Gammaproteobacteria bacterium]MBT4146077.1 YtoQ family protein [Gammaproteobacteria bacterium]MBT5222913.1 YtoQ family protein [Gammaproteobacteria bacterium]MBT5825294.1 YtoQ family protein [Gammaproteobacteria bacterium]MBT5967221.1 YtoQ family protein [Gammaproteobacteria bacterium]